MDEEENNGNVVIKHWASTANTEYSILSARLSVQSSKLGLPTPPHFGSHGEDTLTGGRGGGGGSNSDEGTDILQVFFK